MGSHAQRLDILALTLHIDVMLAVPSLSHGHWLTQDYVLAFALQLGLPGKVGNT